MNLMKVPELDEWKLEKKTAAYEALIAEQLDHDQYRMRLQEIDMITNESPTKDL